MVETTGDEAIAAVYVENDERSRFLSNYRFLKEDGNWKLDLMSTFSLEEKILRQNQKRSGRNSVAFIENYLRNTPGNLGFTYRAKRPR